MRTSLLLVVCACGTGIPVVAERYEAPPPSAYGSSPLASACDSKLIVAAAAGELFIARADGIKTELARVGANGWVGQPLVRGRFIAVNTADRATVGGQTAYANIAQVFGDDGALLASAPDVTIQFLSEHGIAAGATPAAALFLLRPDGTLITRPELQVAGDFGPNGELPVWVQRSAQEWTLALFDTKREAVRELAVPVAAWSTASWLGDTLVYIGIVDGQAALVRQRGETALTTVMSGAEIQQGFEVVGLSATRAVLVTGSWAKSFFTVDLTTGVVSGFGLALPTGMAFAGPPAPSLGADGELVVALRDAKGTGMFRSFDNGKSWSALGPRVEGATYAHFAGRQGTWLMSAVGGLAGASARTVGVATAVDRAATLPAMAAGQQPTPEALSQDGRCAAVWHTTPDGVTLSASDLWLGIERSVLSVPAASRLLTPQWL